MKVLLDTCALVWSASEPESLSPLVRDVLTAKDTSVFVSPISCAEIACLQERGRIAIDGHWKRWFSNCMALNRWLSIDISLAIVQEAYSLPETFHRDPADRLLVSTARLFDLAIVTADQRILDYPHVRSVWY